MADEARREWRTYGTNKTTVLEERRRGRKPSDLVVRVTAPITRWDRTQQPYTAYQFLVWQQQRLLGSYEHRYSEFHKLYLQLHTAVAEPFPAKQWRFRATGGRLGNQHHRSGSGSSSRLRDQGQDPEFVQQRCIQLDAWLVAAVEAYNTMTLNHPAQYTALRTFLLEPPKPPCDQPLVTTTGTDTALLTESAWKRHNFLQSTMGSALRHAIHTVQKLPQSSIPPALLDECCAVLFLTVFKAGFVVSGRYGTGLLIRKLTVMNPGTAPTMATNTVWSAPCAVALSGLGWGAQVGTNVTHYLILWMDPVSLQDLIESEHAVQLTAEHGITVGPHGTGEASNAAAAASSSWSRGRQSHSTLHHTIQNTSNNPRTTTAYTYAMVTQGFFVGYTLEGSYLQVRHDINTKFYDRECDAYEILQLPGPVAATPLYHSLTQAWQQMT